MKGQSLTDYAIVAALIVAGVVVFVLLLAFLGGLFSDAQNVI